MIFEIDPAYLVDVTVRKEWSTLKGKSDLSNEDLIKIVKGEDRMTMVSSIDHPEFTKLREQLGEQGYIKIERGRLVGR